MDDSHDRDELARTLRDARLTTVRGRVGYDADEVDVVLADLARAVEAGQPCAPLVERARFDTTRRGGYDVAEVDALLARAAAADRGPAGGGTAGAAVTPEAGALAARIRGTRFRPVRLGSGYDLREVDRLLDELAALAETGRPLEPAVSAVRLDTVRLREGYDVDEVEAFLRELAPGASRTDAPAPTQAPGATAGSVVEERPGLLDRLRGRRR